MPTPLGRLEVEHERFVARHARVVDEHARLQRPGRVDADDHRVRSSVSWTVEPGG